MRGLARFGLGLALAVTTARAGMTTTVALRSQDDSLPKLGLPSVRVVFQGPGPVSLDTLRDGLAADVLRLCHVRDVDGEASPDYFVVVRFVEAETQDPNDVRFEASLLAHDGSVAWMADGRTVRDAGSEATGWQTIGRNVLSALFRDGWLQPKYDPDDPPPAAPTVERKAAAPR